MYEKLENLSNKGDEKPADKYLYGMYKVLMLITILMVLTIVGTANAREDYNLSTLSPKENGSNNNDLPVLVKNAVTEDQLIVPRAGRSWRTSAVDGSVKMFSFVASTSNAVYASVCGTSTLAALGLVGPAGALASMTACAVGLGLLAVVNWASFVVSSHNDNG